jgi:acetoin utilization protein AcuB
MRSREYMVTEVVTANLRDGLRQTWDRMHERGVRHMPVLGDNGELVGIVSDRDLRRPSDMDGPNTTYPFALDNSIQVSAAMTSPVVTIGADDPIDEALDLFIDRKFGALPVVGEDGELVGILSAVDLLRACRDRSAL